MSNMVGAKENALQNAIEITKVICSNSHSELTPNKKTADDMVEFIKTLKSYLESGE